MSGNLLEAGGRITRRNVLEQVGRNKRSVIIHGV